MERVEKCFFCERTSPEADLVAWFVQNERRTTHGACWLEAYSSKRRPVSSSADPGQPLAVPRSDQAPRKTLDDIRRELEAEYPDESDAQTVPVALDEEASVVERHRSASRRRRRRRRYAMAVLGGIAGSVLLVVSHVAVTRGTIPLAAIASAPDVPASNAAGTDAEADRTSPDTSAGRPTAAEHRGIEPRDAQPAAAVLPLALLTELDEQLKALRSDLQALAASLDRSDSRIAGMESRVRGVESSMRRLADDVASAAAIRAAERPVAAAPRQTASRPVPVAPVPPAPAAVTVADSRRWIPAKHSASESSSTSDVRPVAEAVASPEPGTAATTTPGVAPTRAGSAVSDNASRSSVPPTFGEKLRADWRTIKQGFASAGDELKASMRDFSRKTTRE